MQRAPHNQQPARRALAAAVAMWMAVTVIVSLLAWLFAWGDSPVIHTTHVSMAQVLLTAGSVVSPPLITIVLAGLFLWWALSRHVWVSRTGIVLLLVGIALTGWDTAGGLHVRAPGYGAAKWDAVLVIGWAYVAVCALAALVCLACLIQPSAHTTAAARH